MRLLRTTFALLLNLPILNAVAQNIETQTYTVIRTIGDTELRYYPPVMKIQSDNSFNALFNYISGNNTQGMEIPMTTPVYMGDAEGNRVMEFVLPATFTEENTPGARSAGVRVFESEPGYYLAQGFGGYASETSRTKYAAVLESVADKQGLNVVGEPLLLVYNSPYQFFNRRNEVLLPVEENQVK